MNKVINITFADESDLYGYGSGGIDSVSGNRALFYVNPFDNTQRNGGIPIGNDPANTDRYCPNLAPLAMGLYDNDVAAVRAVQNDPSITYDIQGIAFHVASIFDETGGDPNFCATASNDPYPRPNNVAPCPTCTLTSTPSVCYGNTNSPTWPMFGELVESTFIDNGVYSGINNLSEFYPNKYTFAFNLPEGSTFNSIEEGAQYYANIVVSKLNQLGIPLTC